jgi:hypothetical protein
MTLLDVHNATIVWLEIRDVYVNSFIMDKEALVQTTSPTIYCTNLGIFDAISRVKSS